MEGIRVTTRYILLAPVALMVLLFSRSAGRILVVDAPARSDVIVVLAGETDRRPRRGIELFHQGYASRILLDVPANALLYDVSEIEVAKSYIKSLPEAGSIDICPIEGLSTREEAHDVARCLAQQPSAQLLIVTSDFHTRRALSIFRHELPNRSFSIAAAHDDAQFGIRWWTRRQWAKVCLDEWLRFTWWSVVDRWR